MTAAANPGGHKHLVLDALTDQRPPRCPTCDRQMVWGGAQHGWNCLTCALFGGRR
jgi:tRNA(Ile2) C34 agmatinyltransferase TiaS